MKRILSVIILCALVLSTLSSCGGSDTTAAVKAFDKSAVSEKPTEKPSRKTANTRLNLTVKPAV